MGSLARTRMATSDLWGQAMVAWYRRSSGKECSVNAAMYVGYSGCGDDGRAELECNAPVIVCLLARVARKHLLIAPVVEARALAASPLSPDGQGEAPPGTRWEHSSWVEDREHDRRLSRDAIRVPYGLWRRRSSRRLRRPRGVPYRPRTRRCVEHYNALHRTIASLRAPNLLHCTHE